MLALSSVSRRTVVKPCHDGLMPDTFSGRLRVVFAEWQRRRREAGEKDSQNELERLAGLKPGHLSVLKQDKRKDPTMTTLAGLVAATGCSCRYLVEGVGPPYCEGNGPEDLVQTLKLNWQESTREYGAALLRHWRVELGVEAWTQMLTDYEKAHVEYFKKLGEAEAAAQPKKSSHVRTKRGARGKKLRAR